MKKRYFNIISIIVFLLAMALLTFISLPLIRAYDNPELFKEYIEGYGTAGLIIMFFIQIAQIIVAFIPGEVIEFVSGALYGWLGGFIFCCIGITVGQFLVFKTVKIFGKEFVEKAAGSKIMTKYKFLHNEKKLMTVVFLLYFIPGTPKDLLTYIIPLTQAKLRDFLIVSLLARIPSVISSTYAGGAFANQNYLLLAIIYGGIIVFSALGLVIYKFSHFGDNPRNGKI